MFYYQLWMSEIIKALDDTGSEEKADMLRMLTAYAYVKNLSAAIIVKVICGENLVSYAEELHEKYNSLWTLQALIFWQAVCQSRGYHRKLYESLYQPYLSYGCLSAIKGV